MSKHTDAVVALSEHELNLFGDGSKKEWMEDVYLEVGKYWNKLAENKQYQAWQGYNGRSDIRFDKKGHPIKDGNRNQPWSAAFISYVMALAGAGKEFSYSPSHSVYIVKALKEASKAKSNAAFIARRHADYTPRVGDMIACERQPAFNPNFDTYVDYVKQKKYEAHCDFVVSISGSKLTTIGGNVSNSVKRKTWPLSKGKIGNFDPLSPSAGVICVIECLL